MSKNSLEGLFLTGKHPQPKRSVACNPRNAKHYNPKVAANRKKEKARRKHNARMRASGR